MEKMHHSAQEKGKKHGRPISARQKVFKNIIPQKPANPSPHTLIHAHRPLLSPRHETPRMETTPEHTHKNPPGQNEKDLCCTSSAVCVSPISTVQISSCDFSQKMGQRLHQNDKTLHAKKERKIFRKLFLQEKKRCYVCSRLFSISLEKKKKKNFRKLVSPMPPQRSPAALSCC